MKFKFFKLSVIMTIAMVVMSACEKESIDPQPKPEDLKPFAMTYVDFITPNDVQILSEDTTLISVNMEYAEKMGIKYFKDRAVTIWRTMGTVPFIRKITDAQERGNEIILTTTRGEFADMFENVDMSLVSDLHVDRDYQPMGATRSASGELVTDISDKYQDDNGVYHPAVIIFDEDSPMAINMQTRSGVTRNYFTAEELLEQNATFNIINVQSDFKFDHRYPKKDDEVDNNGSSVHFRGKVGVSAELSAYANVSVGFFKLKKFEAGVKGSLGLTAKMGVAIQKQVEKEWERELMPVGGHVMVFWVGPIPVPLVYESSINHRTKVSGTASLDLLASGKYTLSFEEGCLYEAGKGWKNISKESKSSKAFNYDGIRGSAKFEANTGIFYEMGIYFGCSAGPEFSFGPSISAEAEVSSSATMDKGLDVNASVAAYAGLSGEIGAKVKVLGYNLAKWSTTFDLFKLTLFEGSLNWHFSEESWDKLGVEWNTILNQGSDEWNLGKATQTMIPYRLPE